MITSSGGAAIALRASSAAASSGMIDCSARWPTEVATPSARGQNIDDRLAVAAVNGTHAPDQAHFIGPVVLFDDHRVGPALVEQGHESGVDIDEDDLVAGLGKQSPDK